MEVPTSGEKAAHRSNQGTHRGRDRLRVLRAANTASLTASRCSRRRGTEPRSEGPRTAMRGTETQLEGSRARSSEFLVRQKTTAAVARGDFIPLRAVLARGDTTRPRDGITYPTTPRNSVPLAGFGYHLGRLLPASLPTLSREPSSLKRLHNPLNPTLHPL